MEETSNKIIAVDFDGTLCENKWPEIGATNREIIDYILAEQERGAKLILWTNRCGEHLTQAVEWCRDRGICFDAVNANLQSTIDHFGGDPRKIYATEYIDDKSCKRFDLPYLPKEKSSMLTWAENEVKLACKRENPKRKKAEWDYGCACYESALQAFKTLLGQGHSGASIMFTKQILNRLIDGKCLTPIKDTKTVWRPVDKGRAHPYDGCKRFQCKRMGSLFKKVYTDGSIRYTDVDSCYATNTDSPDVSYHSGLIQRIMDEKWPITMPYCPSNRPTRFVTREYLSDHKNGDFDTVAILFAVLPDGEEIPINRYFKEAERDWDEITEEEYLSRKTMDEKRKEKLKNEEHQEG